MPKIAKRDLGAAAADADKDHPLAPRGSTLDTDRTWHRELCGRCGVEATLEIPDSVEVAPNAAPVVLWDCANGHRNAVEVKGVEATPTTAADTDARSVADGDAGIGRNA